MNSTWSDSRDVCKQYVCGQDTNGEADIQIKRENCNKECPKVIFSLMTHLLYDFVRPSMSVQNKNQFQAKFFLPFNN